MPATDPREAQSQILLYKPGRCRSAHSLLLSISAAVRQGCDLAPPALWNLPKWCYFLLQHSDAAGHGLLLPPPFLISAVVAWVIWQVQPDHYIVDQNWSVHREIMNPLHHALVGVLTWGSGGVEGDEGAERCV
jgi:hypothetical protein